MLSPGSRDTEFCESSFSWENTTGQSERRRYQSFQLNIVVENVWPLRTERDVTRMAGESRSKRVNAGSLPAGVQG